MSSLALQVCVGCKDIDAAKRRRGEGGGPVLAQTLREISAELGVAAPPTVTEHPCLGRCTRRGRMSIAGTGRWSWLFEAIDPATDRQALTEFLRAWLESPDGFVAKEARPVSLRKRMLGRVPPT